ncbi:aldehyde dehydrogenase family protein [Saccharomonospora sp. CUA-673]|uniref:aldehyde dehydrogenase family protein n=1 Tax=Saccharomonospora sp. CUA-673 TaxID=1904969 RepID=UPI002101D07E|nr:aldehyde dehydrogenase family protein [Saccharomonospora sp. CUA-673]
MTLTMQTHREELGIKPGLLYIDGEWGAAAGGATWTHHHPATGEEIGELAVASVSDVDAAVATARRVFDAGEWSNMRAQQRIALLRRCGALLREHADELRGLQALDNSVPVASVPACTPCRSRWPGTCSTTTRAGSTSSVARPSRPTRAATTWR